MSPVTKSLLINLLLVEKHAYQDRNTTPYEKVAVALRVPPMHQLWVADYMTRITNKLSGFYEKGKPITTFGPSYRRIWDAEEER